MYNYQNPNVYGYQQQLVQPQYPTIYGKVVDNLEVAKCSDVAVGSYAVFPRGDLSEVYVKSWQSDGTTKTTTYKPFVEKTEQPKDPYIDVLKDIQKTLSELLKSPSSPARPMKKREGSDEQ